jgi:hypothetical protein
LCPKSEKKSHKVAAIERWKITVHAKLTQYPDELYFLNSFFAVYQHANGGRRVDARKLIRADLRQNRREITIVYPQMT